MASVVQSDTRMCLSVVIVNWNSGPHLRRALAALKSLDTELGEILVVDNGSSDNSLDGLDSGAGIHLLRLGENRGFAGGANAGIARAAAPYILLLNPDVEVQEESIRILLDRIRRAKRAALVCGPLQDSDGRIQCEFQVRPLPTFWRVLSDVVFLDELASILHLRKPAAAPREVTLLEQPPAAYWLLRKTAWESLGGFDETFFPAWFEDVDFCKRLQARQWEILYYPDCPARHVGGVSLNALGRREFTKIYYGNLLRYLKKHHARSLPLLWLPVKLGTRVRLWRSKD